MVGLRRVELLTSPLSGVRSNQLSYRPGISGSLRSILTVCDSQSALLPANPTRKKKDFLLPGITDEPKITSLYPDTFAA